MKKIKGGCKPSILYLINSLLYYYIDSKKRKKYLKTETLIIDSIGNLVARGDARLIGFNYHNFAQFDTILAKMFFDKKIDFAFYMGGQLGTYIGIKGNTLYILKATKDGLQTYTWEEFMKCCFDKWIYQ